jgi:hypothetical protein
MANPIAENALNIVRALYEVEERTKKGELLGLEKAPYFDGNELAKWTKLSPDDINDAIDFLDDRSLIDKTNWLGTEPYNFGEIVLNSRGRYFYHEAMSKQTQPIASKQPLPPVLSMLQSIPLLPVGSPFGFTDIDWEYADRKKKQPNSLYVVMGFQFESQHYNTESKGKHRKFLPKSS